MRPALVEPATEQILAYCAEDPVERVFLEDVARRESGRFAGLEAIEDGGLRALCHLGTNVVPSGAGCGAKPVSEGMPMQRTSMRGADFHRHLVRLTALLSTLVLTACGAPSNTESAPGGPDALLGVWVPSAAPERLLTAAGQPPPLNAEAAEIHAARLERVAAGDSSFDQTTWCASPGMPRVLTMPYPFEIRRDGDYLAFIHGWYRWHRVVNLAGVEVDPPFPLTMGFPVGHWENDTLVIRTAGLSDVTVLDASGLPADCHLRLRRCRSAALLAPGTRHAEPAGRRRRRRGGVRCEALPCW